MRKQFDSEISDIGLSVLKTIDQIIDTLHGTINALIEQDVDAARAMRAQTRKIDEACASVEQRVYDLIAMQAPVASDLRFLQSMVYISFNLERMNSHTRSIAKTVRRLGGHKPAASLLSLITAQANLVYRVLGEMRSSFANRDLSIAIALPALDEPVDALYKQFFREFARMNDDEDLIENRFFLTSRYLERISDNAVEIGDRLVFMFTGRRISLEDLAEYTSDEINALYATVSSSDPFQILGRIAQPEIQESKLADELEEEASAETAEAEAKAKAEAQKVEAKAEPAKAAPAKTAPKGKKGE